MDAELLGKLNDKYAKLGEDPDSYLRGLLQTKPLNYWDYVQVETLLSLQRTRTDYKDEAIFIIYHQITELVLKMMIHEVKQLIEDECNETVWIDKLDRLCRYTEMLITSFDVMKYGMNYDDYNVFRTALTPASGFQSAQFRYLEIYCTPITNLIHEVDKKRLSLDPSMEELFENIYWKNAGYNRQTDKKTLTLQQFEDKYMESFILHAKKIQGNTLAEKAEKFTTPSQEFLYKLKTFDDLFNIKWPLVHLETAQHYLDSKGENKSATGGSDWRKYLHPGNQQRKFFPKLWKEIDVNMENSTCSI